MFANGAAGGSANFNDELYLFHAASLLDEWQPHPRNRCARTCAARVPAGALCWRDGALYRPAKIRVPRYGAGAAPAHLSRST